MSAALQAGVEHVSPTTNRCFPASSSFMEMHSTAPLQVSYSALQTLVQLPALAHLEVEEYVENDDDYDDGHYHPEHDLDEEELPTALDALRASFKSAGRSLVIKNNVDAWAAAAAW